jgi:hypothetical protein
LVQVFFLREPRAVSFAFALFFKREIMMRLRLALLFIAMQQTPHYSLKTLARPMRHRAAA